MRLLLALVGLLVLSALALRAWEGWRSRPRPLTADVTARGQNLVLVSLDTVRPDRLQACLGSGVATPNLDRVRGDGFVFSQMSAPAPITLPSHATLFTGHDPPRHGVRENTEYALPETAATLAESFQRGGLETAAFVASFVMDSRFGLSQGFDLYRDELSGPEPGLGPGTVELPGGVVVARAARWLAERRLAERRARERPYFLFVHLFDAHAPYRAPEPFASAHAGQPYDGELAYVDACVGQLLDALEAHGAAERTWIWVVSDHGESLGEHGESTHSLFIYDATMRVASLLRPPPHEGRYRAGPPRLVSSASCGLVDVGPTLRELFALGASSWPVDGLSLRAMLGGESPPEREIYCETLSPFVSYRWAPLVGLRTSARKYVRAPVPELYDLIADPGELRNLAAARPDEVAASEATLSARLEGMTGAPAAQRRASDQEREQLRSLGYLSGDEASPSDDGSLDRNLPDPKQRVAFFNTQFQAAKNLLYAARFEEAIAAFRECLRVDPRNNSIHLYLAGAERQLGRSGDAQRSYRTALRIEPRSPRAWFGLGQALLIDSQPDSAARAFRESLRWLPRSPETWMSLGEAEWSQGNVGVAIAAFDSALSYGGDAKRLHGLLARAWSETPGGEREATSHLDAFARASRLDAVTARAQLPKPGGGAPSADHEH